MDTFSDIAENRDDQLRLDRQMGRYFEARETLGRRRSFTVSVIGTGKVGIATLHDLASSPRMGMTDGVYDLGIGINHLFAVSQEQSRAERVASEIDSQIPVKSIGLDHLNQALSQTDIAIVCVDSAESQKYRQIEKENHRSPERKIMGLYNIELIQELASHFTDYQGGVLVVTNQTDFLSYLFAASSGMNPSRIWGCNQIDTLRARDVIEQYAASELTATYAGILLSIRKPLRTTALTMGLHDDGFVLPITEASLYGNIPIEYLIPAAMSSVKKGVKKLADEETSESGKREINTKRTVMAIREILEGVTTELKAVTVSSPIDFSDTNFGDCDVPTEPLYMGVPRFFNDLESQATPFWEPSEVRDWLAGLFHKGLSDDNRNNFFAAAEEMFPRIEEYLKKEGRIPYGPLTIPSPSIMDIDGVSIDDEKAIQIIEDLKGNRRFDSSVVYVSQTPETLYFHSLRDRSALHELQGNNVVAIDMNRDAIAVLQKSVVRSPSDEINEKARITVRRYDTKGDTTIDPPGPVTSIALDGTILVAGSAQDPIGAFSWDIDNLEKKPVVYQGTHAPVHAVLLTHVDGQPVLFGGSEDGVYRWISEDGELEYGKGISITGLQQHGPILIGQSGDDVYGFLLSKPKRYREIATHDGQIHGSFLDDHLRIAVLEKSGEEYLVRVQGYGNQEDFLHDNPDQINTVQLGQNYPHHFFLDQAYLFLVTDQGLRYAPLHIQESESFHLEFRGGSRSPRQFIAV